MSLKKHSITLISTLVMSFAAGAQADATPSAPACPIDQLGAVSATAYRTDQDGYGTYNPLSGVQLYVPAKEGLTAEWLALSFQRALSVQPGVSAKCRPDAPDAKVDVRSAGSGFWVYLSAPDQHSASALVRWARAMVGKQKAL